MVLGAGGLGLHAMAIAKARGARVVAVDAVASRLKQATRFGADETIDMREYPDFNARHEQIRKLCNGAPDVVLEVAGVPDAFLDALKTVRAGGRVVEVGNISNALQVHVPPSIITLKSLEVIGIATYPPHYLKKSLDFLAAHIDRHPYTEMCDALFPLSKAAEAMDKSERKEVTRAGLLVEQR